MRGHIICGPFFVFRDIFLSGVPVCPGFVALFRTFSFRVAFCPGFTAQTRMFCCSRRFSPGIVGFSGTFSFRVAFCPGFVALFRTFSFCCDGLSRNCGVFRDIFLLWCAVGINKYYFAFCMWFYYFCTANFEQITKNRDNYEKENCCRQLENEYHCCRGCSVGKRCFG